MSENKFTPRAEEVLRLSQEAAEDLGHGYVGSEHLLLGLIREEEGIAHRVLSEFGVTDEEVLSAVSYHTTGKAGMSLLEEIIYVADAIEPGRDYEDAPRLRALAEKDLHAACLEVLEFSIQDLKSSHREIDSDTLEAYTYLRQIIGNKEK